MTACVIALIVWELIAFVFNKRRALVSTWFQRFGFSNPAAMFGLGALAGHFWLYYRPTMDGQTIECPHCNSTLTVTLNEKTGDYFAEKVSS